METRISFKSCSGLIGIIAVLALCLYQLSCLAVIFFTPVSDGQGDYYDATRDVEVSGSIIGVIFLLLPLLLLSYPWLKLFFAMVRNRIRPDYYGLFIGNGKVTRIISVLLAILNVGTMIWLTWDIYVESSRISNWSYEHALCPDYSDVYLNHLLGIIAFWGVVHIAHGIYHQKMFFLQQRK